MFSVIIPLYNKAPYILNALNSVLNQTFQNFEIIIINDGSTDNSLEIVELHLNNFKRNNFEFYNKIKLLNQKNQGVSNARNNAIKTAKFEFIAFLDADDWWEADYLSEMKKIIDTYPNAGLCACTYFVVKNNSRRLVRLGIESGFKQGFINYFDVYSKTLEMPVWTGATIIKKSVFDEENGFKSGIAMGEDFELWVRVALRYPVAFLNKSLSNYNFDVDVKNKAVDNYVIFPPEKHFIFNIDYLTDFENKRPDLKRLLDSLRIYCLFPYHFKQIYTSEYKKEISKVDFSFFSLQTRLKFIVPVSLLKFWIEIKIFLSVNILNPSRKFISNVKDKYIKI